MSRKDRPDSPNPVRDHASFFATRPGDPDSELTTQSMVDRHTAIGDTKSTVPYKVMTILKLLSDRDQEPTPRNIATLDNPAATGIWGKDGKFCAKRFAALAALSVDVEGQPAITRAIYFKFAKSSHPGGVKPATAASIRVFRCLPYNVSWSAVTEGSLGDVMDLLSDVSFKNANGKQEPAITVAALERFYRDPVKQLTRLLKEHPEALQQAAGAGCPYR